MLDVVRDNLFSVHILFAAVARCSSANLLHFGVGVYGR